MKMLLVTDAEWVRNDVLMGLDPDDIVHVEDPDAISNHVGDVDVCLADMQVGSMGGMAIVRAVKNNWMRAGLHPIPIVLMLDRTADEFLAKRSGADAWLLKPFTAQALRAVLARVSPTTS